MLDIVLLGGDEAQVAAVSRAIFHALASKTPRTRYLVSTDARVYMRLAQICPDRVMDWVGRKVMGLGSVRSSRRG